jgi:OPT oligopeptide transporter protein
MFSGSGIYKNLQYFWLIGAATPVLIYFGARRWPRSPIRYLNAPVIFGGTGYIPPATPLIYLSWGLWGFIFNKVIRNSKRGWWSTYNYITSAALDSGLALSTILIFLALLLPQVNPPNWWGNNVVATTMVSDRDGWDTIKYNSNSMQDNQDSAIQATVASGQIFGPTNW